MRGIGNAVRQECGGRLNNRAENYDQPSRRREKAMAKFRDTGTL
jgi:putative transposase